MSSEDSEATELITLCNSIDEKNYSSVKEVLTLIINQLINTDFSSLVRLLYKIDVDEKKLKQRLAEEPHRDSATVIAELIIERQLKKIETRRHFSHNKPSKGEELW